MAPAAMIAILWKVKLETMGTIAGIEDAVSGWVSRTDGVFLRGPSSSGMGHVWFQECVCELELELLNGLREDSMLLGKGLMSFGRGSK